MTNPNVTECGQADDVMHGSAAESVGAAYSSGYEAGFSAGLDAGGSDVVPEMVSQKMSGVNESVGDAYSSGYEAGFRSGLAAGDDMPGDRSCGNVGVCGCSRCCDDDESDSEGVIVMTADECVWVTGVIAVASAFVTVAGGCLLKRLFKRR